jgi:hypothetical protein
MPVPSIAEVPPENLAQMVHLWSIALGDVMNNIDRSVFGATDRSRIVQMKKAPPVIRGRLSLP